MILKKTNAILSIISVLTLFIHVGYNFFAYITFYYNPLLKVLTAIPFTIAVCLHAICGMCAVFLMGDGTALTLYPKQNRKTILQRISAALIFPLLIIHINAFNILKSNAEKSNTAMFILILFLQVLFFAVIFAHTAVSFSKAFVTLGFLSNQNVQKKIDAIAIVFCAILFLATVFAVVRGELLMFLPLWGTL